MNTLELWIATPAARALGSTLAHFLWEGAALGLLLAAALRLARSASARLRYALACLTLLAMPLAFGLTVALSLRPGPADVPAGGVTRIAAPDAGLSGNVAPFGAPAAAHPLVDARLWLVPLWMAGVLCFSLRAVAGWLAVERMKQARVCPAPPEWQHRLDQWRLRLRVARPVRLLESALVDTPVALGFLRPAILLPLGLATGFPAEQVEAFLLHELAHIARRDYLVNLSQSLIEGLLFYHPAVWWVSGVIRAERENCCDDRVVELQGDAHGYARALVRLEEARWAGEPALAAAGGNLVRRIRRLLRKPEPRGWGAAPLTAAGLLVVPVAMALAAWQEKPAPVVPAPAAPAVRTQLPHTPPAAVSVPKIEPPVLVAQAQEPPQPAAEQQSRDAQIRQALENLKKLAAEMQAKQQEAQAQAQDVDRQNAAVKLLQEQLAKLASRHAAGSDGALQYQLAYLQQLQAGQHSAEQSTLLEQRSNSMQQVLQRAQESLRRAISCHESGMPVPSTRGTICAHYGPPDNIQMHPSEGRVPSIQWSYQKADGQPERPRFLFYDIDRDGQYRLVLSTPRVPETATLPPGLDTVTFTGSTSAFVQVIAGTDLVLLTVPLDNLAGAKASVQGEIRGSDGNGGHAGAGFANFIDVAAASVQPFFLLPPGTYKLSLSITNSVTGVKTTDTIDFSVR